MPADILPSPHPTSSIVDTFWRYHIYCFRNPDNFLIRQFHIPFTLTQSWFISNLRWVVWQKALGAIYLYKNSKRGALIYSTEVHIHWYANYYLDYPLCCLSVPQRRNLTSFKVVRHKLLKIIEKPIRINYQQGHLFPFQWVEWSLSIFPHGNARGYQDKLFLLGRPPESVITHLCGSISVWASSR